MSAEISPEGVMPMASFPWRCEELAARLIDAAAAVLDDTSFGHHISKAAIERWFAFELAAALDPVLESIGWVCLVECGSAVREGRSVGNIDLVLTPNASAIRTDRLRAPAKGQWPSEAVAIELKEARLSARESDYSNALVDDMMAKPARAASVGPRCSMWLGVLLTTDGCCSGPRNHAATKDRGDRMSAG